MLANRNSYSKPASMSSENTFRGSLKPKQWRTSYDTKEMNGILCPPESKTEDSIRNTARYETHNMGQFKDRLSLNLREFGNNEVRKLRHVIETTDPVMLDQDQRYANMMAKMVKQKEINNSQPQAIKRALIGSKVSRPEALTRRHNSIVVYGEEKHKTQMGNLKTDRDSSPNQNNSPKRVQTSGYVNTLNTLNEEEISRFGKVYSLKSSL